MNKRQRKIQINIDGYTRFCLTAIMVLLTVLVIGLWADIPFTPAAQAVKGSTLVSRERFRNSRSARKQMLSEQGAALKYQKDTVKRLDDLIELFEAGNAKVRIVKTDDK